MTPNPEQKNEQIEQVDQVKQNAEKLNNVKADTLAKTMEKKNINNPEPKDIKSPSGTSD